ncbi:MAG: SDR family NAD(P)-dependent oxidoreductase [Rivularia sp. (in: Bacteria)]|nr:SDR family NAD(P)-dependent oxidoreductase [Rivularia sp. MS3]
MTVLVTGASGHLGANLVRRLLDEGETVRVLLRHGSNNAAVEGLPVEKVYGDLRDWLSILAAVKKCDKIYHTAAKISTLYGNASFQQELYDCNVLGTRHLLHAALEEGVNKVVVTSSCEAIGHQLGKPSNENTPFYPFPETLPYALTKIFVEHECLKAFADGLFVVIVQPWPYIGSNDFKPSAMGQTLLDFARGKLPAYTTGARCWGAMRDMVEGHILAMKSGRAGQKYTFSTDFLTMDEMLSLFEKITGKKRPKLCIPTSMMADIAKVTDLIMPRLFPQMPHNLTSGAIHLLQMNQKADCSKAKNELGYKPTSIEQAVGDAYTDFIRRGLIINTNKLISVTQS